jgi:exonuclease III
MKIICLNGWSGKLYNKLLHYLTEENPDILCLGEVVHKPGTAIDWHTFRNGNQILPQQTNFFQEIQVALPDHKGIFSPAPQGILVREGIKIPSQWGIATFVRESYQIIEPIYRFKPHYDSEKYFLSRDAHIVKVFDHKAKRFVKIVHMHKLRDMKEKIDTAKSLEYVHKLLALANEPTEKKDALIICGSSNVEVNNETLKKLSDVGLTELVSTRTSRGARNSQYKKKSRLADYMIVNENVHVMDFKIVFGREITGHCPLILTI